MSLNSTLQTTRVHIELFSKINTRKSSVVNAITNLNRKTKLFVTDSQAFYKVKGDIPNHILITSFSTLFTRQKIAIYESVKGIYAINTLNDREKTLITKGYTPSLGISTSKDLEKHSLIVRCGEYIMNRVATISQIEKATKLNISIVSSGMLITFSNGIFHRTLELLKILESENLLQLCD